MSRFVNILRGACFAAALLGHASIARASTLTPGIYQLEGATFTINGCTPAYVGCVANTIETFDVTGSLTVGASSMVTGGSFTYDAAGAPDSIYLGSTTDTNGLYFAKFFTKPKGSNDAVTLYFEVDANGLPVLCSLTTICTVNGSFRDSQVPTSDGTTYFNGGILAATPEPGSLVLLGTGVLGALCARRRRKPWSDPLEDIACR
jgi:hypothetical protein